MTQYPDIDRFFGLISPWARAYVGSTLSFVALLHKGEFVILAARLRLSSKVARPPLPSVTTTNITAGAVPIAGNAEAVRAFVDTALAESPLIIGESALRFPKDTSSGYSAYHDHASAPHRGWQRPGYVDCLRLSGARRWDLVNPRLAELEREVQPQGYRGLDALMVEFGFGLSDSDMASIEITAEPVLEISASSKVVGRTAQIEIHAADHLETAQVTSTLVDAQSGGRSFRRSIAGGEFAWSRRERGWMGTYTLQLPERSILTCRGLYGGSLHDEAELYDPAALPNLRRTIVELADPGLRKLESPITAPKSNQEQNDFEAGIAVLLYMLGFDTVRVGGVKKLSDAADIFARTPSGRILVVECTTQVLNPKDKLGKLLTRIEEAKVQLSGAIIPGFRPERVIGVVAIPRARSDLGADWKAATERGVLVLCRAEIEQALATTRFPPNADRILDHWLHLGLMELTTTGLSLGAVK